MGNYRRVTLPTIKHLPFITQKTCQVLQNKQFETVHQSFKVDSSHYGEYGCFDAGKETSPLLL